MIVLSGSVGRRVLLAFAAVNGVQRDSVDIGSGDGVRRLNPGSRLVFVVDDKSFVLYVERDNMIDWVARTSVSVDI